MKHLKNSHSHFGDYIFDEEIIGNTVISANQVISGTILYDGDIIIAANVTLNAATIIVTGNVAALICSLKSKAHSLREITYP